MTCTKKLLALLFCGLMVQKNIAQTSDIHRAATEYAYREQWDSAIACYNRMPIRHDAFYFDRGMCYHLNRQFKEAVLDFSALVQSSPENTDGWLLLAESSLFIEDFAMAKMAATKFLRNEPENCAAKFIKGCAFLYTHKRRKASRCFQEAMGLDGSYEWPKIYGFAVFGITSESLTLPRCFQKNSNSNLLLLPSNTFEEWVFDWHCNHLLELK